MSASRDKKSRQDATAQGPTQREQKKQQEAQAARRSNLLYAATGIVCVVLALFLLVWNSGLIQRSAAAVTVNGVKYTASDVQYYLKSILAQNGLSSASSLQSTVVDSATGATMYDYLVDQAVEQLVSTAALADKAEAEGYVMSEATQSYVDEQLAALDEQWAAAGYKSLDAFLQANYDRNMTADRFRELYTRDMLVNDYSNTYVDSLEYSDADYESYYKENADTLDSYTISQFVLLASVSTTDSQGNPIEMTDEEKSAALEEAKTQVKATAEELQAKLESGADPAALAEEYGDQLSGTPSLSETLTGSSLSGASYADWAKDSARKTGDVTISESDTGSSCYYYVVRFEGRQRDDSPTDTVRHILVAAETDEGSSTPTDAQYDEAKAKAEALLDQWKAGEATESSFAKLAQENSADTGSAADGGLISNIYSGSGYVSTFTDWAIDDARQPGDTGIVQNTGSSVKGWHIMYYVGAEGDPVWRLTARSSLLSQDYSNWISSAGEGYEAARGIGMKFVQG